MAPIPFAPRNTQPLLDFPFEALPADLRESAEKIRMAPHLNGEGIATLREITRVIEGRISDARVARFERRTIPESAASEQVAEGIRHLKALLDILHAEETRIHWRAAA